MFAEGEALLIRTDAGIKTGTGHFMRCISLAQAWQDGGGRTIFLLGESAPQLEKRLVKEGTQILRQEAFPGSEEDALQTVAAARRENASWVVIDGYHFGAEFQEILKDGDFRCLFIDDYGHSEHYCADLVLNQNLSADVAPYVNREHYTQLMLGTEYALLRREFVRWCGWQRSVPDVARKILVTFGGGDPANVTLKAIRALRQIQLEGVEAKIIVGGSNPNFDSLREAVNGSSFRISLEQDVTDMPDLMGWADAAISAAGSTCWELAFMGLPALLVSLADNQLPNAEGLAEKGAAVNLGWFEEVAVEGIAEALDQLMTAKGKREEMTKQGRRLVDGQGASRVVEMLKANSA